MPKDPPPPSRLAHITFARAYLGRWIENLRRIKKLSQRELAARIGLPSARAMSWIESGRQTIRPEILGRLEIILEVRPGTWLVREIYYRLLQANFEPQIVGPALRRGFLRLTPPPPWWPREIPTEPPPVLIRRHVLPSNSK